MPNRLQYPKASERSKGDAITCMYKWGIVDSPLCDCGELQFMVHTVCSCPNMKFEGG